MRARTPLPDARRNNPLESGPAAWDNSKIEMKWSLPIVWASVVMLLGVGLLMMCSLSYAGPVTAPGSPSPLALRHAAAIATGLVALLLLARLDYRRLRLLAPLAAIFILCLLMLVLVPRFSPKVAGMHGLLPLGPLHFRPSDLAGPALVLFMPAVLAREGRSRGVGVALGFVALVGALVFAQHDFSAAFILVLSALVVLLLARQQRALVLMAYSLGLLGFALLVLHNPIRLMRILAFFSGNGSHSSSFWMPLEAIKSGGWLGLGLGQSTDLQAYFPDASSGFMAALVGAELGGIALAVVALSFVLLVGAGFVISHRAPERFGRLLGFGICALIAVQAVVHFAVVFRWLSSHGVALPFVSYGRLGLVVMLGLVGILLSIARSTAALAAVPQDPLQQKTIRPAAAAVMS